MDPSNPDQPEVSQMIFSDSTGAKNTGTLRARNQSVAIGFVEKVMSKVPRVDLHKQKSPQEIHWLCPFQVLLNSCAACGND